MTVWIRSNCKEPTVRPLLLSLVKLTWLGFSCIGVVGGLGFGVGGEEGEPWERVKNVKNKHQMRSL